MPQLLVWNKIDLAGLEPGMEKDEYGRISRVFVSAGTGAGLDLLRDAIAEYAKEDKTSRMSDMDEGNGSDHYSDLASH